MSGPRTAPTIRVLTHAECDALLARQHVGRLAFAFHDRVDIQPIHYAYEAGWIYGRTSEGAKLVTIAHNPWVAFEVDEFREPFHWDSVVVRGSFHRLDPDGTERERGAGARALHLLRSVVPEMLTSDDPTPSRTVFFRIAVGDVTGRSARPGAAIP